jgi:hypothetical protein
VAGKRKTNSELLNDISEEVDLADIDTPQNKPMSVLQFFS